MIYIIEKVHIVLSMFWGTESKLYNITAIMELLIEIIVENYVKGF